MPTFRADAIAGCPGRTRSAHAAGSLAASALTPSAALSPSAASFSVHNIFLLMVDKYSPDTITRAVRSPAWQRRPPSSLCMSQTWQRALKFSGFGRPYQLLYPVEYAGVFILSYEGQETIAGQ